MTTMTLDVLKFARTLKDAGVPDSQAEAFAHHGGSRKASQLPSRRHSGQTAARRPDRLTGFTPRPFGALLPG